MMISACLLAVLIELSGVVGENLRARAFFDANNVTVGDPLILTIDFLGEADFQNLHPPALSRMVDRKDWKLDDASAKTDTFRDARRLTYRIRPRHTGVLFFPALEFGYTDAQGSPRVVRSNEIPVHAKPGAQVVVDEMGEDSNAMPTPPELIADACWGDAPALSEDQDFQWRKALSKPSEKGFAAFEFPAGRMNAATCALRAGNWATAQKIYRLLEWRVGQTPEIERGLRVALALRYENPQAELPIWRQLGRPVLRYAWAGRVGILAGSLAAVVFVFWALGRLIRIFAALLAVMLAILPTTGLAQDIFQQMEAQMQRMRQQMHQQMNSGFSFSFGGEEQESPKVTASATLSRSDAQVGEGFEFILALEAPRSSSIGEIRIMPSQRFGMTVTGPVRNLPDGTSANSSNLVKRLAVPVRYDVPFKGNVAFTLEGMISGRNTSRGRRGFFSSFTFSNSFKCETAPLAVNIRPLATAGQPAGFAGVVSEGLRISEQPDILRVETNDVVTITYRVWAKGYVPADFLPEGAAFEWSRDEAQNIIEYRRYFIANGAATTPTLTIDYYDPRTKKYCTATAGGTRLVYLPSREQK